MRVLELSYRAILHHREQSLSLKGEERKTSKCERDCECDVRAAMPQAACNVGVGRRAPSEAHATSDSRHCHWPLAHHADSHARTLTCFAFLPTVLEEKRVFGV